MEAKKDVSYTPAFERFRLDMGDNIHFTVHAYTLDEYGVDEDGDGIPDRYDPYSEAVTIATPDGLETFIIR